MTTPPPQRMTAEEIAELRLAREAYYKNPLQELPASYAEMTRLLDALEAAYREIDELKTEMKKPQWNHSYEFLLKEKDAEIERLKQANEFTFKLNGDQAEKVKSLESLLSNWTKALEEATKLLKEAEELANCGKACYPGENPGGAS